MISSFASFKTFLRPHSMLSFFPPAGSPFALCYSLRPQPTSQMQGTATQTPQVTRTDSLSCKMHPNSITRILPVLITPRHLSFHESFIKLPGQVAGTTERLQRPAKFCSKICSEYLSSALYSSTSVSSLHCQWIRLDLPAISSAPPPVLLPPSFLPPPLINAAPSLTIIGAASFLHSITAQQREKPPHATSAVVMERFRLQKRRLINQKANLKTCRVHTSEVTCCSVTLQPWSIFERLFL